MPENRVQITLEDVKNINQRLDEEQKDEVKLEVVCNLGNGCRKVLEDFRADILALGSNRSQVRFLKRIRNSTKKKS